jgi:hypothetical protein
MTRVLGACDWCSVYDDDDSEVFVDGRPALSQSCAFLDGLSPPIDLFVCFPSSFSFVAGVGSAEFSAMDSLMR